MNAFRNTLFILLISFVMSTVGFGQEETAAGVYNDGLALLKAKNYEEGLAKMLTAIELAESSENEKVLELAKKNGSIAASNLGNTSYKKKDFETAMTYYTQGMELNPENSSNVIGMARAMNKLGQNIESVKAYIAAGDLYQADGKADRAQKSYKQAQNIVGQLYVDKSYDDALAAGEAYLGIRDGAEVRYYVSRSLIEKNENQLALDHINKAIELSTAKGKVADKYYMAQGMSLENLGRNDEAVSAYSMIKGDKYKKQAEYRISQLKA